MGEDRGVHRVLVGRMRARGHWGDQDVDGRIILRWIFNKSEGVVGTGWRWLRIWDGSRALVGSEKLSGSINAGNSFTSCKVYWLVSQ